VRQSPGRRLGIVGDIPGGKVEGDEPVVIGQEYEHHPALHGFSQPGDIGRAGDKRTSS
jgi:hypothetical protein